MSAQESIRFAIIGAGKVGTALCGLLTQHGSTLVDVVSRRPSQARKLAERFGGRACTLEELSGDYECLFLTVNDDCIAGLAEQLCEVETLRKTRLVAHTSGVHSALLLKPLQLRHGCAIVAMHPVASITDRQESWRQLQRAWFTLDGDRAAVEDAGRLIESWGGQWCVIESDAKATYHAGAVFASNYVWTLLVSAMDLWESIGLSGWQHRQMLVRLAQNSLENLASAEDVNDALTGPIARADLRTVERHLEQLQLMPDSDLSALYRLLGSVTARRVWESGNRTPGRKEMLELLQGGCSYETDHRRVEEKETER